MATPRAARFGPLGRPSLAVLVALALAAGAFPGVAILPNGGVSPPIRLHLAGPSAALGPRPLGHLPYPQGARPPSHPPVGRLSPLASGLGYELGYVSTGFDPAGLGVDPSNGYLYVADSGEDNVTVIDGSTNLDVALIPLPTGSNSVGATYDPLTGYVYVPDSGLSVVTMIDPATNTSAGSLTVGSGPAGVAVDTKSGLLYVTDSNANNVSVVNTTTYKVVATVNVGATPWGVAYDAGNDHVYVTNLGATTVSVINASTNRVSATINVGAGPAGVLVDPANHLVYVSNFNAVPGTVSVINASTNQVVKTVTVGTEPFGLAEDPANGYLFVADEQTDNVTVLNGSSNQVLGVVYVGQYEGPSGMAFDAANGCAYAADYGRQINATSFSVGVDLSVICTEALRIAVRASTNMTETGQPVGYLATASGGLTPYEFYNWSWGDGSTTTASSSRATHAYGTAGTYVVQLNVTDANGTHTSWSGTMKVIPRVEAAAPTANRSTIDLGQGITVQTTPSHGQAPYPTYRWSGSPPGCTNVSSTPVLTCLPTTPGNFRIGVTVTDALGVTSVPNGTVLLTVYGDPVAIAPSANRTAGDVGQSVSFSESPINGSGNDTYAWNGLPAGCPTTGETVVCPLTGPGNLSITVVVTDSNRVVSASSPTLDFAVSAPPTVQLSANRSTLDAGQSVGFSATGSPGSGGDRYAWSGLPVGCPGQGPFVRCVPSVVGDLTVSVNVTDSNGATVGSSSATVVVHPALSVAKPSGSASPTAGAPVDLTVGESGGTPPVSTEWTFGDGSRGVGLAVMHTYRAAGTYPVTVWVNDSAGASAERSLVVTVGATNGTAGPGLSGGPYVLGAIAVIAVLAIAAAGALLLRRRRTRVPPGEPPNLDTG